MKDVTRFLEEAGVDFDLLEHPHTERAADEAAALGVGADEVAKTIVLIAASDNARAVLAASDRIDLHKVAAVLGIGSKKVHLASEDDLARDYPDFELGAVPPFGGRDDRVERLADPRYRAAARRIDRDPPEAARLGQFRECHRCIRK